MSEIDKRPSTRDALLRSAEQLFTEKGYSAVSTRELAELAGVNLGAIQYHFGSKAQLFVETVRCLMSYRQQKNVLLCQCSELKGSDQAAVQLWQFIEQFIFDLCFPDGPDACRLMHREIHGATSKDPELYEPLVSLVVEEFIRPIDARLRSLLKTLNPDSSDTDVLFNIHSIIGQCLFYMTNRPFIERLREIDLNDKATVDAAADSVARFTLTGLGLNKSKIDKAHAAVCEMRKCR